MLQTPRPEVDKSHSIRPRSQEAARRKKSRLYDNGEKCEGCAHIETGCSMRFTSTGACVQCSRIETQDYWDNDYESPRSRAEAIERGETWYLSPEMCEKSGHIGVKTLDGDCAICAKEAEKRHDPARPEARRAGLMWYTPAAACDVCHQTAPRRVSTNSCKQCELDARGGTDGRETASSRLMRENPAMVIDRATARALGFKVYRTGKACQRGHTAWRQVTNGGCLECKS